MSASLVGSEMCIRDSRRFVPRVRSRPRAPPTASWAPRGSWPFFPAAHQPVSYTHLTLPTICSV
eukprot:1491241-Alexandrium_andersonii.AAC.1